MHRTIKIYIGILILFLIGIIVNDLNRPKPIDWTPSFFNEHKSPYGTYILYNELKNFFSNTELVETNVSPYEFLIDDYNYVTEKYSEKMTYFFVNNSIYFGDASSEELLNFVSEGNTVLMISQTFPKTLRDTLGFEVVNKYNVVEDVKLSFANEFLSKTNYFYEKAVSNNYFDELDKERTTVLGYNEVDGVEKVNFVKINYGAGEFLLNTQPYAFTNYHMLESDHAVYVSNCLSYLSDAKIIWDNRIKAQTNEVGSKLRFILSKPQLKWAWFLSLFTIFIFMIFRAKRRQRIVPIIPKQENTSIAFARTIGDLYYNEGEPKDIVHKKITFFLEHIRNTYLLDTQNLNEEFKKRLQLKTGISKEEISRLVNYIVNLSKNSEIKEHSLVTLNKLIDKFYKKTKL